MIHLTRLPEPKILVQKKAEWLNKFLQSGYARPSNTTYGHTEIRRDLDTISHHKCFYCERLLRGVPKEIDHYIEITCDRTEAFKWENLFLACSNCNDKIPHNVIPVGDALNPFLHTNEQIEEHVTFNSEVIRIKNDSLLGNRTIKKYRLDSDVLEFTRSKFLNKFYEDLLNIRDKCSQENRFMNEDETEALRKYSYPDHPYSLMFKVILRKRNLL